MDSQQPSPSLNKLIKHYEKKIAEMNELDEKRDFESSHGIQDEMYEKFIKDISNNKFNSIEEIKTIAKLLKKKVINIKKERWYA